MSDKPTKITVMEGISGWYAVMLMWDKDIKDYDIWSTGFGRYRHREDAVTEARGWAEAEEAILEV
jgi:hypothetical protein